MFRILYCLAIMLSAALITSCGGAGQSSPAGSPSADTTTRSRDAHTLRDSLSHYISTQHINIGVAVMHLERGDTVSVNGRSHYAMMSVCKVPQAMLLLHLVDSGILARNAKIHITRYDMTQPTRSSLAKDHPLVPFDLSIPDALSYAIGQSDNITSNVIFALDGGPAAVEACMHRLGIADIGVAVNYRHIGDSFAHNWITPLAAAQLLNRFYTGKVLTDSSRTTLWQAMVAATSGKDRLPGLLPPGTVIGHKTGTSGRNAAGECIAFNDIGIVQLPDGNHVAIAVFIANSALPDEKNARIIADIGKMVWDHYTAK